MGNCSNITNTQTVSLTSGTITSGFCHTSLQTTYEEFIARTSASLSGNVAAFTAGDDTPSSSDQNKLWWKQDASNCNTPLGWFYYNTSTSTWENAHPVKDNEITSEKIGDNEVSLPKLTHGTKGDILYYGTSGAPARLSAGASGQFLKTQGSGQNPTWATIETPELAVKAIVVVPHATDTYFGATQASNGTADLTSSSFTLDASTTYLLEWSINIAENSGGASHDMQGHAQYSTDGASWVDFADVRQYETKSGDSGHGYNRATSITFVKGFTTNSTGGTYYFKFDTNETSDWKVHDFVVKIMKGPTFVGGATHPQA